VAVHPEDARYTALIGKQVRLPITGRLIPIVADEHADPELGSGAVKITPGHDFRSEEHTSELQSRRDLVCRLLLEKKTTMRQTAASTVSPFAIVARNGPLPASSIASTATPV